MNLFKKIGYSLFFLLFVTICNAQQNKITQFQHDSVKFLDDLESYLNTGLADKSSISTFMKQFKPVWQSSAYTNYYKRATYRLADKMLSKNMEVYPTFQSFLYTMLNFAKAGLPEEKFNQWDTCFEKQMNKKPYTNLNIFLSVSQSLFGSGIIFESPTVNWSVNTSDYRFNSDSVQEIIFDNVTLKCINENKDTVVLYDTKGVYSILKGTWKGVGGKTDWTRTGLEAADVYAELKNYAITLREGGFVADSVTFWNKNYFESPLEGKLIERDISEPKDKETYPRFISYSKRVTIPNLTPDVTYDGGFAMRGRRFVGSGTKDEPAQLVFKRNDKPFLIASSLFFGITKSSITSDDARINILLDGDSIYHPDIQLIYSIDKQHVSLIRSSQGLSQAPFFDTYHKVSMFFEELSWYTNQPEMEFRMIEGSSQTTADFESQNFFRPELFEKMSDPNGPSPVVVLAKYSQTMNKRDMTVDQIASYMHITADEIRPVIFRFAIIGLVNYDVQTDKIHIEDKLLTFIDNELRKADYDVVDYHSQDPAKHPSGDSNVKDNGVMNLNNYDISINGVDKVILSDSQSVRFYPLKEHLVLHRNREATFAGEVRAGRFLFFGKQFDFNYADFKIKMKNVDSVMLYANAVTKDSSGKSRLVRVRNTINHLSGELVIDQTTNKSGLKPLKQYPILTCDTNTFVYYDKKSTQNGVYKRDSFYFKADPFIIDSVANFSNARLHFDGSFVSDDIIPEMRETLRLQPDTSLGFVHDIPADGLALYKGKGKMFNKIKLSNKGLIGDGSFKYITSVSKSHKFVFLPDSMNAEAETFDVTPQESNPEFPQLNGDTVKEHWLPKQDVLFAKDLFNPFSCYDKFATFHGTLKLSPELLSGNGQMNFLKASLTSEHMDMLHHRVISDTSDFALRSFDSTGIGFSTKNMKADIDFHKREGDFLSNQSGSMVEFPENQYIAYMDQFKWLMDQDDIEMGSNKKQTETTDANDLQLTGTRFISVSPHQDSLQFISAQARYSLRTHQIKAHEVPYIDVADARIVPDSGNITVLKHAYMVPFTNASITANKVTKYYDIYKANLNITSRKNYTGSGYYNFIDGAKNKHAMFFSNIRVDTSLQTVANTEIAADSNFSISPNFRYKGKVNLEASNPFLDFNGECRIQHSCNEIKIAWFKFSGQVDPDNVQIPIGNSVSENNLPLAASPVVSGGDSISIYSAFLSPVASPKKDIVVVSDSGEFLTYDSPTQQYRIASKEKLTAQTLPGNYVSLDTRKCIEYGEGNLNLGASLLPLDMKTVGDITDYIIPDSAVCNVDMLLNFFFDDGAISKMVDDINGIADLKALDVSDENYQKNLRQIMSKDEGDKLISQLTLYGTVKKLPKELTSQLFLCNLRLKWHNDTHSYISEGSIGIGSVGSKMLNKEVTGVIEIRKRRQGDELNIYLEIDPMHWYFFSYVGGQMQVASSNDAFNSAISSIKPDKREQKTDKGKATFNVGDATMKRIFMKRIYGE